MTNVMDIRITESLADLPKAQWDALAGGNPFLSHAFLLALQESGCTTLRTGWEVKFLTAWQDNDLVGAMPMYRKHHSYGEFVFDWAWAEAYQQNGFDYYPKLLCAVPYTPITGARLLANNPEIRAQLARAATLGQQRGAGRQRSASDRLGRATCGNRPDRPRRCR